MTKTQESNTSNPMATGNIPKLLCTIFFWIVIMLIPLIFLLPNFFSNKVFAVFLAEPVSDILAAAVTTITFFTLFNKILKKEVR